MKQHKQWRAFSCLLVIVFDAELQYLKCSFTSFVNQIKSTDNNEILKRFWQHKLQLILLFCFNQPLMVSMIIRQTLTDSQSIDRTQETIYLFHRVQTNVLVLSSPGLQKYKLVTETGYEFEFEMVIWCLWLFF